ncbi:N-acetylmuramoyl-L-alanine amidase [Streptomyces sp. RB6PN25]|uniref:N-acetylmuramoyl-L-alanine amidase n=1 Tax=Streptomyces humicola TaxID=2953240 RepID=A0ABT1Q563_9ACTN|nr:N-acetylmuramoyl-L-alanine amidase [Streptomyces humicola]MCQ4085029.1 N-acetylmuramoyl-L-alanine amidase [Streptomyces humicola]
MRPTILRSVGAASIGAAWACAAALILPSAFHAMARAAEPDAGSTLTLPLVSLGGPPSMRGIAAAHVEGLPSRTVKPFALLGITWDDAFAQLDGTVEVRTRSIATHRWSGWQQLESDSDDVPDPNSVERQGDHVRGSTPPLWVGDSDGVQVRIAPTAATRRAGTPQLPRGLRLDLVDPGSAADPAGAGEPLVLPAQAAPRNRAAAAARAGLRPRIITRVGWGANRRLRSGGFLYNPTVKAVFVHHTATGNHYSCSEAPRIIRAIYRYHVRSLHWRDIGYNFLVDKCGRIYEGRAGGVSRSVMGAHTFGFNRNTVGIAVIGSYNRTRPSSAAIHALARLTAWKLGRYGHRADGNVWLVSGGGNKYRAGRRVRFARISGHRDGNITTCPGARLYAKLPEVRREAARLQGYR